MGNLLNCLNASDNASDRSATCMEALEERQLMAAGPRVWSVFADNRGEVVLTMDRPLNPATVTTKSVALYTTVAGRDKKVVATVKYTPKTQQIAIAAPIKADTPYKIWLNSKVVKGLEGARLDGEFVDGGKLSGNGVAGGDYLAVTKVAAAPLARFYTLYGNIDVTLFKTQTPLTVNNFLRYANHTSTEYNYDNTFIHRSVKNFVIQGGGFKVTPQNTIIRGKQYAAVPNEPRPNNPGNVRGTIAMAKLGDLPNSATNQWFFNLGDNRSNLDVQNGGFTVFGKVANATSLKNMDKIAALKIFNLDNAVFTETPLVGNGAAAIARGELDPAADLVLIRRIAIKMDVVKVTAAAKTAAAKTTAATTTATAAPLAQSAAASTEPAAAPAVTSTVPSDANVFARSSATLWDTADDDNQLFA